MGFDYAGYYRRIQDLKRLQLPAGAVRWSERYEPPDRACDVVLYLGCNILRTPDIAADAVAVFTALGLDFRAVAGVQYCCGITWDRAGDVADGRARSESTIERLASYGPRLVVHWCPSCDVHFDDVVIGRDGGVLPFEVTSAASLIAGMAEAGAVPWQRPVAARTVIHGHEGRPGHASGRRRAAQDTERIGTLLRHLPGIEHLGAVTAPVELDYDCGPSVATFERGRWREIRARLWHDLVATGTDLVVTKSHGCQREWSDLGSEAVGVRCWISLVADALGCERDYRSNPLPALRAGGDAATLVQLSRTSWASHGLSEVQARQLVEGYDWSGDRPELPAP